MGVERLIALMKQGAVFSAPVLDAYVVRQGDAAQHYAQNVAERMRDEGLDVALHSGGGSFKSQMKKADASGARYAVVIGDDEAAAQKLTLKPLRAAAEQATVALDAAVVRMRARD
jgi:histidyl-tRNA synthetase